jgi:cyclophilin family peptidyl-prolyl cis-trans isomerase
LLISLARVIEPTTKKQKKTMKTPILLFLGAFSFVILGSNSGCTEASSSASTTIEEAVEARITPVESTEEAEDVTVEIDKRTKNMHVKISTQFGDMVVKLYDETPQHRDNFVKLVEEGYYNDLLFHRVMKAFMVQGGDPDSKGAATNVQLGRGGPDYKIPAEFNDAFTHKKGALAAARQGDQMNPTKASSGSQFYIVQGRPFNAADLLKLESQRNYGKDSTAFFKYTDAQIEDYTALGGYAPLDGEYTVFGEVVEGLDIIDSIAAVPTMRGDRPKEDVKMQMEIVKRK